MKTSKIENDHPTDRPARRVSVHPKATTVRNFWPYGVIFAFALFITGTVGLVVLACSQKMDLVSSDYYEEEIKFQNQLDQLERTRAVSTNAYVIYDAATQSIRIVLPTAHLRAGLTGNIKL